MIADAAVIGGGNIGLAIAGELAGHLDDVVLFEKNRLAGEAAHASGGMLAPFLEVEFGEHDLLDINLRSLRMWPSFAEELKRETGTSIGFRERGSLYLALHDYQVEEIRRLYEYQQRLDLPVNMLPPSKIREIEPEITNQVRQGLFAEGEKHVDNRKLSLALTRRCHKRGVRLFPHEPVTNLHFEPEHHVQSIRTSRRNLEANHVIVAAGAWAGSFDFPNPADQIQVRPVKGQACSIQFGNSFQPRTIVRSPDVYGVPHYPDRLTVGATMEEKGFETTVTAGGCMELLESMIELLPGAQSQPFLETWTGLRPASPDNKPYLGPSPVTDNLYFATGHYRNGILLTPFTAKHVTRSVLRNSSPEILEPFAPGRSSSGINL